MRIHNFDGFGLGGRGQVLVGILLDMAATHGCRWETFYMFAYGGLVVEIQPLNC